nr:uncharacterized protein CI109_002513 [Kwoniella shandongensis]KAA5529172.1 hypothetical protein CI109_002513 [Kwoniella shandongensis]
MPPSAKPPSYLASTAASRAKNPRPTASQLFDSQPTAGRAKKAATPALDPTTASIPCPVCPDFTGVNILDHCRNRCNHPRIPFVRSNFGRCQGHIQTCDDCGTVMKTGKAALSGHKTACKGRSEEMVWRRLGGTEYVVREADRSRTYRLPTIPGLSSSGTMRMRVFAAAPPASTSVPAQPHPTPPSLTLSRDEPRSDPMGPLNSSSAPSSPSPSPPPVQHPVMGRIATPTARPTEPTPLCSTTPRPRPRISNVSQPSPQIESTGQDSARTRHQATRIKHTMADLLPLHGSIKHLHPNLVRPFITCANRLAAKYNAEPSEETLFDILALVKVGLAPEMRNGHSAVIDRLGQFPEVQWPRVQEVPKGHTKSPVVKAKQLVEAGLISKAARILSSDAKIAALDDETIEALKSKHPVGHGQPFHPPLRAEVGVPTMPESNDILLALKSFRPDTSPGPSGWTVKLMTLACSEEPFRHFLTTLTTKIAAGVAEGKDLLRVARLTPLLKPDGGIRPIAVGEMFYRLAMKAIFTSNFDKDSLSTNQFGVGSKGGVETIIHGVQHTIDKHPAFRRFRYLTSLDASNAFNALATEWSYGTPSELLVYSEGKTVTIESSEGVKQGDPLGPLLFSLAIKDAVDELQALLGEKYLVLAYLDDIFILGEDDGALQKAIDFFGSGQSPLRLNRSKCKQVDLDEVMKNDEGFRLLGSCVGSVEARQAFLQKKIEEVGGEIRELHQLPKQHALLILRFSCQQKLRHLQQTLLPTDLDATWDELDNLLWTSLDRIRGFAPDHSQSKLDRDLLSLPPAMGGVGLSSYRDYSPLGYKAATSLALSSLCTLVDNLDEPVDPLSQRELCKEANTIKHKSIMASLPLLDRISVVESSSQLGRKWLSAIPSAPRFVIPDAAIQSALFYRTLQPGYSGTCRKCSAPNTLGHDENCMGRSRYVKARHDAVKHRLAAALKSIPGSTVVEEPYIVNRLDRLNDIKVTLDDADNRPTITEEYDLKIISLYASTYQEALQSNGKTREERMEFERLGLAGQWEEETEKRALKVLAQQARRKVTGLPAEERERVEGTGLFTPLVLSTGGLLDEETMAKISDWKRWNMPGAAYGWMLMSISVALVRARARTLLA